MENFTFTILLCTLWSHRCLDLLVAYGKAPENSGANERSATNVSTPVTLSTSSLHRNTALRVDRKSVASKTLTQLITIIKPSWHASYKYWITHNLWYETVQKLTRVSLSDELFAQTTQQPTTTMATTTTTTTTSTTTEISTTVLDFTSHNNSLSSEYDLSGKKRFAGSHVLSHTSTFVDFRSIKQHYHITNMHDRCSKNVVKTYSLFSYLTFFSRPWNNVFFFVFFLIRAFTP